MGLVYAAEQLTSKPCTAASKLLKPGMDSERVLARFALERQVLQQLDHPCVTRIFEAGTQSNGRPFFAMELVESAAKIIDFCDERRFGIVDRIRLLIEVCGIVQHAHHRGVIHRDLKPSNILVSRTRNPPSRK